MRGRRKSVREERMGKERYDIRRKKRKEGR